MTKGVTAASPVNGDLPSPCQSGPSFYGGENQDPETGGHLLRVQDLTSGGAPRGLPISYSDFAD